MKHDSTISALMKEVHAVATHPETSWYKTNPDGSLILRPVPTVIALMHSELSEAFGGDGLTDTHLPQFTSMQVELADCLIRILDTLASYGLTEFPTFPQKSQEDWRVLMLCAHQYLSFALEADRKDEGRGILITHLQVAAYYVLQCAEVQNLDIITAAYAKTEYNKRRQDHKISTRAKAGGKKY